jgi:phosphotransferase system HPr (HPr) family protein
MPIPTSTGRAELVNAEGFHLGPADRFVRLARRYRAGVRISCGGARADGKSLLDLATPAAGCGTWWDVEAGGPEAEEAVAARVTLIEAGFPQEISRGPPRLEVWDAE